MSVGTAPIDWAASSRNGTPVAVSASVSTTRPLTQETCETATSRVAGPTASAISSNGATRTSTPARLSRPSGASRPGCSSSEVTTWSPARRSRPDRIVLHPSVVEPVSATSDGSACSTRA